MLLSGTPRQGGLTSLILGLTLICAAPAGAQTVLPSGQSVAVLDRAVEVQSDGSQWLVMRYLAPRIGRATGDLPYDAVVEDLDALCEGPGLQVAADVGPVDQIVIVLLDRPVERGVPDPDVTQFISAYAPTASGCEWR